ncbi:MAG: FAD-dependent oxidoreductase [Alphaproteobacteria bacterium]|nr:FAD-dependent oxidoreductase [Alphaproteobacteria bacterium]MDX5370483.1 FAD-dependent oxidoreductase [Alphaproteobacteria bacterium]MDX5464989.1 FAD-dependent oxidoreductase [Alphaproteobacteria bacterium]
MRIAVIGSGVSGLAAAWALSRVHDVILYEAEPRLGGHANTVTVVDRGRDVPVDTGFIVYNEHNYPNLVRFFDALGVPTQPSDMSFAVSADGGAFEYAGDVRGLVAQPANLLRRRYWRMLADVVRFYRSGASVLAGLPDARHDGDAPTLRDILEDGGYSETFAVDHLLPMAAAIWSSTVEKILDFPAETFLNFFVNHGLLNLGERPRWRTVTGGSRSYVEKVGAHLGQRVRLATPVAEVRRTPAGVVVIDRQGHRDTFDEVILATHADQSLALLGAGATVSERGVLGRFRFQPNLAILHTDPALMPRRRMAWASWNYLSAGAEDRSRHVTLTYWMNRLQGLETQKPLFVTLNPLRPPAPETVVTRTMYRHPVMDRETLKGQGELPSIQGLDGIWHCGAWCGYGFHEDGAQAGFAVAAALGAPVPWADAIREMSPAGSAALPRRREGIALTG